MVAARLTTGFDRYLTTFDQGLGVLLMVVATFFMGVVLSEGLPRISAF
jgi:hypothetical protein